MIQAESTESPLVHGIHELPGAVYPLRHSGRGVGGRSSEWQRIGFYRLCSWSVVHLLGVKIAHMSSLLA
jgi:hypothetical protein